MCIYMNLSLLTGLYMRATLAFNGLKKDIIKGELWPHPDKIILKNENENKRKPKVNCKKTVEEIIFASPTTNLK